MSKIDYKQIWPRFRKIVAGRFGSDPSRGDNGSVLRSTIKEAVFSIKGQAFNIGVKNGIKTSGTNTITVDDNDFSTGKVYLYIGDSVFISGLDYMVGANAIATATNIVSAINLRVDYLTASNGGTDIITLSWVDGLGKYDFKVRHTGEIVNLILSPTTGYLAMSDAFEAPDIT